MPKKKYYRSNLSGSYRASGIDIPPKPTVLTVTDADTQKILDSHPSNGRAIGFSEIERPQPIVTKDANGQVKQVKKSNETGNKQPAEPEEPALQREEKQREEGVLAAEDVTNLQMAKKYLLDNHADEVDERTMTNADSIREASEGVVDFPNWKK